MRAYLAVTATIFGLLAVVHVVRMIAERGALGTNTTFTVTMIVVVVVSAALCVWGFRLMGKAGSGR